jgi:hypothetical protein
MFTIDFSFLQDLLYCIQTDFYVKALLYFLGITGLFELVRSQISEVDLLQLVPGFYFFLFFLSFIFLIFFSEFLFLLPSELETTKAYGTKTKTRFEILIFTKLSFFLGSSIFILILNTIVPLSLDSFNISGEKTLENTWSLTEVIFLELVLIVLLVLISQIPIFFVYSFNTQLLIVELIQFWKILLFVLTLIAGFLTPTLDGYTQISFTSAAFLFYLLIVNFLQKRLIFKPMGFIPFGS